MRWVGGGWAGGWEDGRCSKTRTHTSRSGGKYVIVPQVGFGCTQRVVQENMVCLKSCPKILAWVKKRTVMRNTNQCLISEWRKNGKGKINKGMEIKAYRLGWNEFGVGT